MEFVGALTAFDVAAADRDRRHVGGPKPALVHRSLTWLADSSGLLQLMLKVFKAEFVAVVPRARSARWFCRRCTALRCTGSGRR